MTTTQTDGRPLPATIDTRPTPQVAIRHELTVEDVVAQVEKIQRVMQAVMKPDVHYGIVPGTGGKPSLLKAGAEKLCLTFRLDPQYDVIGKDERPDLIAFMVRCTLYHIPTGERIASGIGSCSSREEKYAYRKAARVCPSCQQPTIIKGKAEYGGGWLCFGKKGGCGAKYRAGDPAIESQPAGKVPTENIWDQHNTILKMAEKRALVAAVLNGTAASDFFTQDVEDLPEFERRETAPEDDEPPPSPSARAPETPAPSHAETMSAALGKGPVPSYPKGDASPAQQNAIRAIARKLGEEPHAAATRHLGRPVEHLDALSKADASAVIKALQAEEGR